MKDTQWVRAEIIGAGRTEFSKHTWGLLKNFFVSFVIYSPRKLIPDSGCFCGPAALRQNFKLVHFFRL